MSSLNDQRPGPDTPLTTFGFRTKPAPSDLPEHSYVSYNPNRTRFVPPDTSSESVPDAAATTAWYVASVSPAPEPQAPDSEPGRQAPDRYDLVRLIGRGGCGEVWEAIQVQLDRPVAVKRLRGDRLDRGEGTRAEMLRLFREEALIAARLDHPNIVPVYDYGITSSGQPELSMKLVRGQPWERLLKSDRETMPYEDLLPRHVAILAAVANSVAFAHSRRIVHRDIKPSQVMVGDYGEVLLMDWGLAILMPHDDSESTDVGGTTPTSATLPTPATASSPAGTPAYMAPEQTEYTAEWVGPWTDVYLLGGCLYCVLVGTGPYGDSPSREVFSQAALGRVQDPRERFPGLPIPDELADLAMAALRPNPAERVESASAFVQRLESWISGASRRRESEKLTAQIAVDIDAPRIQYSEFVSLLERIQEAEVLWPGNPAAPQLRARAVGDYAQLALLKGDLLLAETETELLPDADRREDFRRRIQEARQQRIRLRKRFRASVAAVLTLIAVVIAGGYSSLRRIERERTEALTQKDRATGALTVAQGARAAAESATLRAVREQRYAQVRYATSLVDSGRHEAAREVLWSIPPEERNWEWAWLIGRSHQTVAEFPFRTTEASAEGSWLFVDDRRGGVEVRDTMAGALVARLDVGTTDMLLLVPHKDTHLDLLVDARRLTRWSPPDWRPSTIAEFERPVVRSSRDKGSRGDLLVAFDDRSAALLDGASGKVLCRYPAQPGPIRAVDGSAWADLALIATKDELAIYRRRDGVEIRRTAIRGDVQDARFVAGARSVLLRIGAVAHLYSLEKRTLAYVNQPAPRHGNLASDPRSDLFLRSPDLYLASTGRLSGQLPVGNTIEAKAKFIAPGQLLFWNGANGEAGVMQTTFRVVTANLAGLTSPIENAWGTLPSGAGDSGDGGKLERIFTTTADDRSQVWMAGLQNFRTRLPGQWASFRDDGAMAVSISPGFATLEELDKTAPPYRFAPAFSTYRLIVVNEERRRIYTFGLSSEMQRRFGWEVYDMDRRSRVRLGHASRGPGLIPPLWTTSSGDQQVLVQWEPSEPLEVWSTEEGTKTFEIPYSGSDTTALIPTPWQTVLIGDAKGTVREHALSDGTLIRTFTIDTPVLGFRSRWKRHQLLVSGGDGRWRLYDATESGMRLKTEQPTGAGPVLTSNFSRNGDALVALTTEGTIAVWDLPDGRERVRMKVDGAVHRVELSADGSRIFGLGEAGLYVWDMEGREVGRVPSARDISRDGRRILMRSENFLFSRDMVVDLPPHSLAGLPGSDTQSHEERYQLYRRAEYRDWWRRQEVGKVPPSLLLASQWRDERVIENAARIAGLVESLVAEIPEMLRTNLVELDLLVEKHALLLASNENHDFRSFLNAYWFDAGAARLSSSTNTRELVRRLGPVSLLHCAITARLQSSSFAPGPDRELAVCSVLLDFHGRTEDARKLARFTLAKGAILGWGASSDDQRVLRALAGAPIPAPPAELVSDTGQAQAPWLGSEMEKLAAAGISDPREVDARQKELERELRSRRLAWIATVTSLPDFKAIEAEARLALPPPLPDTLTLGEFLGDTLDRLERELLDGQTLPEAEARILATFDASCADADREAAAKASLRH